MNMMATSLNASSYNRKRQRLLSSGSTKPQLLPKKQHYADSINNEIINLDSDDEDYIFNTTLPYHDDEMYPLNNSDTEHNHYLDENAMNLSEKNIKHQNPTLKSDIFASHNHNSVLNSIEGYDHNLNLHHNPKGGENPGMKGKPLYYNNRGDARHGLKDRNNWLGNHSQSSIDSEATSTRIAIENYNNGYDYNIDTSNDENAIIDYDDENYYDLTHKIDNDNRLRDGVDDNASVDFEFGIFDGDRTSNDSYRDFVDGCESQRQTRHMSFTNPLNHIFKRFIKNNRAVSTDKYAFNKNKKRTKSLPQLSYTKMTYSPALDKEEVSLKIGDIHASLINHSAPNYTYNNTTDTTSNSNNSNLRKFSFQNHSNKTSLASNQTFTSMSKSSARSSYDDQMCNNRSRNDMQLINVNIQSNSDKAKQEDVNCDDEDGYYIVKSDAPFANGRFVIKKLLGQGTFGKVVKAYDYKTNSFVAIKIIKSIKKYREASKIELRVLTMLKKHDPTNKFQCIHLRECFDYRNHICIVTDLLKISLYDFMEKNQFLPFPGSHIQAIAKQLLRSVAFLHDLNLIHTDLKPENILIKDASYCKKPYERIEDGESFYRKILKDPKIYTIDFGSAIFQDEYHSSIISTRHYRAPEIILGVGWSYPCDIWSVGSILIELLIGEALFKTHENEQHLAMMEKVTGEQVDLKMVRKCLDLYKYNAKNNANTRFDTSITKCFSKKSGRLLFPRPSTSKNLIKEVENLKSVEELVEEKVGYAFDMAYSCRESIKRFKIKPADEDDYIFWYYYIELIKSMLIFDPDKRITAKEALGHKWFDFGILDDGI